MFKLHVLLTGFTLCFLTGCPAQTPAPAEQAPAGPAAIEVEEDPAGAPPAIEGDITPEPLAPEEDRAPGSLSCTLVTSTPEEIRIPVTATYDPNSDFARLSVDAAGDAPRLCSLVLTHWSSVPESGSFSTTFTREQLREGAPDAQAFFVVEHQNVRWVADELTLTLSIGTDTLEGQFSAALVNPEGQAVELSNGLFTAPLRRLELLPPPDSASDSGE